MFCMSTRLHNAACLSTASHTSGGIQSRSFKCCLHSPTSGRLTCCPPHWSAHFLALLLTSQGSLKKTHLILCCHQTMAWILAAQIFWTYKKKLSIPEVIEQAENRDFYIHLKEKYMFEGEKMGENRESYVCHEKVCLILSFSVEGKMYSCVLPRNPKGYFCPKIYLAYTKCQSKRLSWIQN